MPALAPRQAVKYEALGNDYLVMAVDDAADIPPAHKIAQLCDRHRGLGSDGLLVHLPSDVDDAVARLRIYNPDGSEAEKSGNGLRIFARYLADFAGIDDANFVIALGEERIAATLHDFVKASSDSAAQMSSISLAMGRYRLGAAVVAYAGTTREDGQVRIALDDGSIDATLVSVGNPHCVVFDTQLTTENLRRLGPRLERHPAFARRTNVQLVRVVDFYTLEILIWERGAGETLASGSSSCAAAVAAYVRGLCGSHVTVRMPGGTLEVVLAETHEVTLRGTCTPVFLTSPWGLTQ